MRTPPPQLQPGTVLDRRFLLKRLLGEGGFGWVFLALDLTLDREPRDLKVLDPVTRIPGVDPIGLLVREVRLAQAVKHPSLCAVYDVYTSGPVKYFSMEYVAGERLSEAQAKLSGAEKLSDCVQICEALNALHSRGIIHRDLKPQNVMVHREGGLPKATVAAGRRPDLVALDAEAAVAAVEEREGVRTARAHPRARRERHRLLSDQYARARYRRPDQP